MWKLVTRNLAKSENIDIELINLKYQFDFHCLKKTFLYFKKKYYFLYISIGFGIGIGRYEKYYIGILSVSADMKIGFIGDYRYWPIWKNAYRSYTNWGSLYWGLSIYSSRFQHDVPFYPPPFWIFIYFFFEDLPM